METEERRQLVRTETSSAVKPELELMLCKILPATLNHMLLVQQGFIQQILTELLLKIRDTKLVPVSNSTFKMGDKGGEGGGGGDRDGEHM